MTSDAIASLPALLDCVGDFAFDASRLRSFEEIPSFGFGVVPLRGMVVVYQERWQRVEDGGMYVIERQRPVGGMSWETYDRFNRDHGSDQPRCRIQSSRGVIQARWWEERGGWWFVQPNRYRDGPYHEWALGYDIVGEVVGLYRASIRRESN